MRKSSPTHKQTILAKMLTSMLLSLLLMFALLASAIFLGGMIGQLRNNAFHIFGERVSSRRNNLNGEMVQQWTNLGESVEDINRRAAEILAESNAQYSDFTADSPLSGDLLDGVSERLFYQLRRSEVTGIFVILNGEESRKMPVGEEIQQRAGVYLRDYDPDTSPADNSDLMLERAPMAFVKQHDITLDTYWQPIFTFHAQTSGQYFYKPFQAALSHRDVLAEDLGYWGTEASLDTNSAAFITYSLPLLAEDGTPYGVFGVELTLDYLAKKLPSSEISGNGKSSYVLAKGTPGNKNFEIILPTGMYFQSAFGSECENLTLEDVPVYGDCYEISQGKQDKIYGCLQYLNLYNTNTPFVDEQWAIIGVVQDGNLLGLYHSIALFLVLAMLLAFGIGIVSVCLNTLRLSRPIMQLAKNVRGSDPNRPVLLGEIGVVEIDELSAAIETLSRSVADSYSTLSKVMAMAGYRVGAFEYLPARQNVRYTDDFFSVLRLPAPENGNGVLPIAEFRKLLEPLSEYPSEQQGNNTVFHLVAEDIWVRMQVVENAGKTLGVVNDVTMEILQRKRLEYERDYDSLTMLPNRRAFHERVGALLESKKVRIAAMVMMDLDNLKYINDTYGHDVGDSYLRATALVLRQHTTDHVLTARMSGDEFFVFIYGDSRGKIEREIAAVERDLSVARMDLPDGEKTRVRVSAGIAWYPKDTNKFTQLIRYADFAMYRVKHTTKGRFSEFNQGNYDRESYLLNNKEELNRLIEDALVRYEFQAIVDAKDGSIYAYEALMRPTSPMFASPLDVLAVAHSQSKLYEIERLTIFKALEAFASKSAVAGKEKLFVNSISNQLLGSADLSMIEKAYRGYLPRMVVELTEEEKADSHLTRAKDAFIKRWHGQIALDDFGAGYNGEVTLLTVSPDYIKIDQVIVRNIDQDGNRRQIVENIMEYAKRYHIAVIGEGVETKEEMETLLACGVHYLQGYYVAYPNSELIQVSEKVRQEILEFHWGK